MFKIENTADLVSKALSLVVYGPSGVGKTHFIGTAALRFTPIILSVERGLLSLQSKKDDKGAQLGIDFITVDDWRQVEEVRLEIKHGRLKSPKTGKPYDLVAIDSLTELQELCTNRILFENKATMMQRQDWGALYTRMANTIKDFRAMGVNMIITALETTKQDEESGIITRPSLQGQFQERLPGFVDEVFYLLSKNVVGADGKSMIVRKLVTQGTQKIVAKDRSGKLAQLEDPDFCAIYDKIYSKKET